VYTDWVAFIPSLSICGPSHGITVQQFEHSDTNERLLIYKTVSVRGDHLVDDNKNDCVAVCVLYLFFVFFAFLFSLFSSRLGSPIFLVSCFLGFPVLVFLFSFSLPRGSDKYFFSVDRLSGSVGFFLPR
jgi:hypothetical protein